MMNARIPALILFLVLATVALVGRAAPAMAAAERDVVSLVQDVTGAVTVFREGSSPAPLAPKAQLRDGDVLDLAASARVTIIDAKLETSVLHGPRKVSVAGPKKGLVPHAWEALRALFAGGDTGMRLGATQPGDADGSTAPLREISPTKSLVLEPPPGASPVPVPPRGYTGSRTLQKSTPTQNPLSATERGQIKNEIVRLKRRLANDQISPDIAHGSLCCLYLRLNDTTRARREANRALRDCPAERKSVWLALQAKVSSPR